MRNYKIIYCLEFACILCCVFGVEFKAPDKKCNIEDFKCVKDYIVKYMLNTIKAGNKDLGIEAIDPIHLPLLENKISDLKYTLTDSVVTGYKDIILNFLTIEKRTSMHFDITIPHYEMHGNYKFSGKLLNVPLDEEGKYYLNATNLHLVVDVKKEFYDKDGKEYLKLSTHKASTEQLGTTYLALQTPNGEEKVLPGELQKIAQENPKAIAEVLQADISVANANKMFEQFNNLLKLVPITDLVDGEF